MRRRHLIAVAFCALLTSATARAQDPVAYLALVHLYAGGQDMVAVSRLAAASSGDVANAVKLMMTRASSRDLMRAIVLHTELANAIIGAQPDRAIFHVDQAVKLLQALVARGEAPDGFSQRWHYFTASMYVAWGRSSDASWYVREGLMQFPKDPMLYVIRGLIVETGVRISQAPDLRRGPPKEPRRRASIEQRLKAATAEYQRALTVDEHNASATLHLGWLRFFLEDGRATGYFEAALADAKDDSIRYLAHLFLGGVAERDERPADALREYEAARRIGPGYQTPCVAVSRTEQALGESERARETAMLCATLVKADDDPWWDFGVGFDRPSLQWLRAEAHR